ncbi:MAG: cytochrome-c peroxidase [Arcicella sp.]|nr:cytochrome-c peroxidase [Arcicella sp.]
MKNHKSLFLALLCLISSSCFIFSCKNNDPEISTATEESIPLALKVEVSTANPQTIALGKMLFWDPILSGNKDVACATCHHPANGYADNLDLSIGLGGVGLGANRHFLNPRTGVFVKRNSQTILNTAFNGMDVNGNYDPLNAPMFWDSRVKSLENQSVEPIKTLEEMRGAKFTEINALDSVVARLKNIPEYQLLFKNAFGGTQAITASNMSIAIATFERTLTANNSPFDRYKRGEKTAMNALEIQGMNAFQTVGCAGCHRGSMFSDYQLHVLSVPDNAKLAQSDAGANGTYGFRTASLRNLKATAPYMHSGVFSTLDDILRFYGNIAGGNSQNPNVNIRQVDAKIRNVRIQNNQAALIAFINTLSDDNFDKTVPATVPSKLNPGGNIK